MSPLEEVKENVKFIFKDAIRVATYSRLEKENIGLDILTDESIDYVEKLYEKCICEIDTVFEYIVKSSKKEIGSYTQASIYYSLFSSVISNFTIGYYVGSE